MRPERKKLYESEILERKVATRLSLVGKELQRIADERRQNKVGDEQEISWHEDLRAIATGLAERDVPEVARVLEVIRKAPEHDALALRGAAASQETILTAIRDLAARINRWGDYTEVIRELRNLMGDQKTIFKKTQGAVRDKHKK